MDKLMRNDMTNQEEKIARLEEEKSLLWEIISDLERWMFLEGCFISERTKAKIAMAKEVMEYIEEPKKGKVEKLPKHKPDGWTPEKRKEQAERCRARMLKIHAEKRAKK